MKPKDFQKIIRDELKPVEKRIDKKLNKISREFTRDIVILRVKMATKEDVKKIMTRMDDGFQVQRVYSEEKIEELESRITELENEMLEIRQQVAT